MFCMEPAGDDLIRSISLTENYNRTFERVYLINMLASVGQVLITASVGQVLNIANRAWMSFIAFHYELTVFHSTACTSYLI